MVQQSMRSNIRPASNTEEEETMSSMATGCIGALDQNVKPKKDPPKSEAGRRQDDSSNAAAMPASFSSLTNKTKVNNPDAFQEFEIKTRNQSIAGEHGQEEDKQTDGVNDGSEPSNEKSLIGTHLSFTVKEDDGTASTSSSHPTTGSHTTEGEGEIEEFKNEYDPTEGEELSQDALMAAIAVATAKKGEESSYTGFFEDAAAEAVAAAEQMEFDCFAEPDEIQAKQTEEDIFQLIEQQISSPDRSASGSQAGGVAEVLSEIERVLFFTDVVDQNPPSPTPSSVGNSAIVSSASLLQGSFDPWWEAKMQEVSDTIYKSGVEVYNEVEKGCKELERTLLFTDLPDNTEDDALSPRSAVILTDISANDTANDDTALTGTILSSKSDSAPLTGTVLSSETDTCIGTQTTTTTLTGPRGPRQGVYADSTQDLGTKEATDNGSLQVTAKGPTEAQVGPLHPPATAKGLANKKPKGLKLSNVGLNPPELTRVFKTLEKNLLFTDMPDEAMPKPRSRNQTASTRSGNSALSVNSNLGMCPSEVKRTLFFTDLEDRRSNQGEKSNATSSLVSQILADDQADTPRDLQQLLEARMQQLRRGTDGITRNNSNGKAATASIGVVGAPSGDAEDDPEVKFMAAHAKVCAEDILECETEDGNSIIAPHNFSDLTSEAGGSNPKAAPKETGGDDKIHPENYTRRPATGADLNEDEHKPDATLSAAPSTEPVVSASEQEMSAAADSKRQGLGYQASAVRKADDASTVTEAEQSVRLLVEVPVKSASYSTASGALVPNDTAEEHDAETIKEAAENALAVVPTTVEDEKPRRPFEWQDCTSSLADTYATAEDPIASLQSVAGEGSRALSAVNVSTAATAGSKAYECLTASSSAEARGIPSIKNFEALLAQGLTASTPETSGVPSVETFDALLAEMRDLENAINFDLKRAHTVLRNTTEGSNEQPTTV